MRQRKKGFSLVELIVSFAILAIIALSVSIMMSAGTNSYLRVNKRISLSYVQHSLKQIEEYVTDCNGICQENGTTYITKAVNSGGEQKLMLYALSFDEESGTLSLTENTIQNGSVVSGETQPISDKISAFDLEFKRKSDDTLTGISITMTAKIDNSTYTKNKILTFRNTPINPQGTTSDDQTGEESAPSGESGTLYDKLVSQVWEAYANE